MTFKVSWHLLFIQDATNSKDSRKGSQNSNESTPMGSIIRIRYMYILSIDIMIKKKLLICIPLNPRTIPIKKKRTPSQTNVNKFIKSVSVNECGLFATRISMPTVPVI